MNSYKLLFAAAICSTGLFAQTDKEKDKWNVSAPKGTTKEIEISTNEGTWMGLDVSPDGKTIIFDMLGDIYSMPITGGEAKVLRNGFPYEVQPRFSPDGKKISFTSDAGGGDNIWTMNADGSDAKQITKENFRLLNNAVWTPDGQFLIARKHFSSTRSLGAGEMWMYHITGGEGSQLTVKKNAQQDAGEPNISPDGRYVYFSEDMYPGGYFQYNKDPNSQIYVIKRLDRTSGESQTITGGPGGAFRPQISRDGKTLAFVRRVRTASVLYLRNMETGEEWPVYDKLSKDQQEAWAIFGVYSNFNWLDASHIIIWANGKIWNINTTTTAATEIPFNVKTKHTIVDALRFRQEVAPEKINVKVIRNATASADEKTLVFNSVGYLWKKDLPNSAPVRLTTSKDFEFEPSFSLKGDEIVYTTWNDDNMGAVYKMNLKDKKPVKITSEKGIYRTPRFSADGKWIVYQKEEGNDHMGFTYSVDPGIYVIENKAGAKPKLVTKEGFDPRFIGNDRIFFQSSEGEDKAFKSISVDGKDLRINFTSKYATSVVPSSDGKWVAFIELFKVYVSAFPLTGKPVDLSAQMGTVPVTQVAKDAGLNLEWSADNKKIHWTYSDEYFTTELKNHFTFLEGAPEKAQAMDSVGIKINLEIPTDKPKGKLAFKNARIITMKGDEIIENGVIIINENKIEAIGKADEIKIPADVKTIDCNGKTIMPGMVDVHSHLNTWRLGPSPQKQWSYYANLAFGVTTTHDPSSVSEMVFSQSEMVKAGYMVGPRVFSTGTILYGAEGDFKAVINSLDDARSAIARTKAFGAFSVKSYNQPRREQRQQVIQAARDLKIMVVPEGGSTFYHNMSEIIDGHTGIEHNIPIADLSNDVIKLWSASKTGYTPTLIVTYGAINGEDYWYQKTNVWENKRLLNFYPRSLIDSRSRHRKIIPEEEYVNGWMQVSRSCKKLTDAGVKVNLGSHGQIQGIGAHWELWMLQAGGMTPLEAIRCATMNGAHYIGMDDQIGSLEKGKLADLLVMDKNPLEDIRNTESIKYVMVNGRLFDSESMNEIGNYDVKRGKFYFENSKSNNNFPWHEETKSFMQGCEFGD
ncbi:MAG: amidohydrolase [Bacteroidetes bacterium]|jgi:imidazolonepropionase-like amidohydrolase/Tol biopolymer transport system component|nr:amidohydrolase [Bacteroidota bacterium]